MMFRRSPIFTPTRPRTAGGHTWSAAKCHSIPLAYTKFATTCWPPSIIATSRSGRTGCLPEYFPVLVAAFEAMDKPDFNFHGSTASTGGSAPLLIVSGPVADDIGMNADVNLFGPGNRANATIGRAVRLILRNVFQMLPGISDKSTQGQPAKYSFCIAERARGNPWPLLCEAQGYPEGVSSVTVFASGGFCNVENHGGNTPEQILGSVADAMANSAASPWGRASLSSRPSTCTSSPARAGAARMPNHSSSPAPSGRSTA
jgi:hypothetical protein